MRYEPRYKRRWRRITAWHRRFAWFPREMECGQKVWLEKYWARFEPYDIPSDAAGYELMTIGILHGVPWGHWRRQLEDPMQPTTVIAKRRIGNL